MRSAAALAVAFVAALSAASGWVHLAAAAAARTGTHAGPALRPHRSPEALLISDQLNGTIWVLNSSGHKLQGQLGGCSGAAGLKVDHDETAWAACTATSSVAEYPAGATEPALALSDTDGSIDYATTDVAVDSAGNVYASSLNGLSCNSSSCTSYPGRIAYWTAANVRNGATPSGVVSDPNVNSEAFFLDTDAAGSVYVDYYGCAPASKCGYGLDQISDPEGRSSVRTIVSEGSGSIHYPGGVYVLGNGSTLTAVDQYAGLVYRWSLPSLKAQSSLGPTPQNKESTCQPSAGGFDRADNAMAIADVGCVSVDSWRSSDNAWKSKTNTNFGVVVGAAFRPSDK